MKKVKVVIYIVLLLLLTGCTAEVNIDLKEKTMVENITIVDKNGTKNEISNRYRKYVSAYYNEMVADENPDERLEGFTYYNRTVKELNDGYAFTYYKTFSLDEYNKATSFKSAFRSGAVEYSNEDGVIDIYTDSNGLLIFDTYPDLESVRVNITTKLEVLDNNADEVKGNTYSWIINRDNKERNIFLETKNEKYDKIHNIKKEDKKDKEDKEDIVEKKSENSNGLTIIIAFLGIIGFLVLVFMLNAIASKLGR